MIFKCDLIFVINVSRSIRLKYGLARAWCLPSQEILFFLEEYGKKSGSLDGVKKKAGKIFWEQHSKF